MHEARHLICRLSSPSEDFLSIHRQGASLPFAPTQYTFRDEGQHGSGRESSGGSGLGSLPCPGWGGSESGTSIFRKSWGGTMFFSPYERQKMVPPQDGCFLSFFFLEPPPDQPVAPVASRSLRSLPSLPVASRSLSMSNASRAPRKVNCFSREGPRTKERAE